SLLLIEVDEKKVGFYQPRPLEAAPPLARDLDLVALDGQQRLTALYQALTGSGRTRYAIRLRPEGRLESIDDLDASIVALSAGKWVSRYTSAASQWADRYIPLTALRTASDFFEWRDAVAARGSKDFELLTQVYRETISGLHAYRVPAVL